MLAKPKTAGLKIICLLAVLPHLVPSSTSLGSPVVVCVPAVAGGHAVILAVACCFLHWSLVASLLLLAFLLLLASFYFLMFTLLLASLLLRVGVSGSTVTPMYYGYYMFYSRQMLIFASLKIKNNRYSYLSR